MKVEIGIDCEPGHTRPDDLLGQVITGTSLKVTPAVSKSFGAFIWEYEVTEEEWRKIQPDIAARLQELYLRGEIRGAIYTPK